MQVCCRACGEILNYEKDDTNPLVHHIRTKHPEKSLVCLPAVYSEQDQANADKEKNSAQRKTCSRKNNENESEADTDELQSTTSQANFGGTKYKYTVQYYGQSKHCVQCPKCNAEMYPVMRQRTNRTLPSLIGALFYLICWPINFLPFLICGKKEYNLYCSRCRKKIGSQEKNGDIVLKDNKNDDESGGDDGGGGGVVGGKGGGGGETQKGGVKGKESGGNENKETNKVKKAKKDKDKESKDGGDNLSNSSRDRLSITELKNKQTKTAACRKKRRKDEKQMRHYNSSLLTSEVHFGKILDRKPAKILR